MAKILVVDDNPQNLYLLQVLLSASGYEVLQAANGADALTLARDNPPDLIISDILMPVMDGFALCRAWKQDAQLKGVPFIFYTATYTDPQDEDFALSLGAERFIIKPAEPAKFLALLQDVLANHKAERLQAQQTPVEDATYYKAYNAALIRKLEDKVFQLEAANRALEQDIIRRQQAEAEVKQLNAELEQRVVERTRELQAAQQQLVNQEKLTLLGRLAGGLAHELRNPLGVTFNAVYYLNILLKDATAPIKEYLNILEMESHTAARIVNDLLCFSNMPTGNRAPADTAEIVHSALNRHPAPDTISVVVALPADLPKIFVDAIQLEQALGKLVINAYQAMPVSGVLTITAHAEDAEVRLTIQDTGGGISPENMAHLFEPLFTTRVKGLGLGLAISRKLIELNGGQITAQSEPGQGSVFTIHLPCYRS